MTLSFFATAPRGVESLLAGELRSLGATNVVQNRAGVSFAGPLAVGYRACLWSRLASRILLRIGDGPAKDAEELYATAQRIDWSQHLTVTNTLAVDFTGSNEAIRDTRFGAVRVKDAIVDQLRVANGGRRPSVDVRAPDVRINAHLTRHRVAISLDLSGESLHRRGYRAAGERVEAPLKENLAAAIVLFAAWPKAAAAGGSFVDPLCGSGTLPIEAALLLADVAPGLLRTRTPRGFGLLRWRGHDAEAWEQLVGEARERRAAGLARLSTAPPRIFGSDRDPHAVRIAQACADRAGISELVTFEVGALQDLRAPAPHGLATANIPYGERLGEHEEAEALARQLGDRLRDALPGWHAAIFAGDEEQLGAIGLSLTRKAKLFNGPLACALGYFEIGAEPAAPERRSDRAAARSSARRVEGRNDAPLPTVAPPTSPEGAVRLQPGAPLSEGAEYLANRLQKNLRRLGRTVRREELSCYRLYDADLPEYNMVVDLYGDWVHVQEYAAPAEIDPGKTRRRLQEGLSVVASVLGVPLDHVVLKERRRQRGSRQYERREAAGKRGSLLTVTEDDLSYLVNLHDYLDTGFFIDQRLTRRLVRKLAGGRRFLNLFAYTGTMTVNALTGGSPSSTTVDLSATYLRWAQRNLTANGFTSSTELVRPEEAVGASPHRLVQADCLTWLAEAEGQYDLVWLDPPTFSNSKRMGRATFDVQRDHVDLITMTARRLLAPGGIVLFATNRRGFTLHGGELGGLRVNDLSKATLPPDCARAASRHHVFQLTRTDER